MIKEYFDTSRNTQAEYIDFLSGLYDSLFYDLFSENDPSAYEQKKERCRKLSQSISTAYDDHYKIHGFHYTK
tara:strand:+ start:988 stop:1203 length:216 start_codon:yes stop_codon:yes gene_type:complete